RVSRFTMNLQTKQLDLNSEVRIFEYDSQVFNCCHRGGGMGFDSAGDLYVTIGDSNSSQGTGGYSGNDPDAKCPVGPADELSNSHCGTANYSYHDARRTAGNVRRDTNAPGYVSGGPASGGTDGWYDCDNIHNDSPNNTGLTVLPHETGTGMDAGAQRPVNVWFSRGNPNNGNGCPEFPRER